MNKSISPSASAKVRAALLLASAMVLAACTSDNIGIDDSYVASTHYERYPIKVAKAPMRLEVDARKHGLQPNQINAIVAFARSASSAGVSQIVISRPSGGGASNAGARNIHKLLVENGVPEGQISLKVYRGSAKSAVVVSYTRAVAVTKECGDWSSDLAHTPGNGPYPNFGCSVQHNIAQMVSNPNDFEVPTAPEAVASRNRAETGNGGSSAQQAFFFF
jgi:pilus assembly protein CpaD